MCVCGVIVHYIFHPFVCDARHTNTHRQKTQIQASLTLNRARADSNFGLQITFQWLHKSAASSSVFFSSSSPSLLLPSPLFLPFFFTPASLHFSSYTPLPFHHRLPSTPLFHHLPFFLSFLPPRYHLFSRFPTLLLSGAGSVNEKQGGRDGEVTCAG